MTSKTIVSKAGMISKGAAVALTLSLATVACGSGTDSTTDDPETTVEESTETTEEAMDDTTAEESTETTEEAMDDTTEESTETSEEAMDDTTADLPATVVDIATSSDDFSTLVAALSEAGLVETLQGDGPFTVFAPTNAAFEKALADLGITAEELLAREDLADILTYHVVPGKVMAADAIAADGTEVASVQGDTIAVSVVDGSVMVDAATVTTADLEAGNGVVHVIDSVILPG